MPRRDGSRIPGRFPTFLGRHLVTAMIVAGVGGTLTMFTWMWSMEERRLRQLDRLGSTADETISAIQYRLDSEVNASRDLATFWQLHGSPPDEVMWHSMARRTIETSPGIQWIAWVPDDSAPVRFTARDPATAESEVLRGIRMRRAGSSTEIQERWSDAYHLDVFVPVGSAGHGVGTLASSIRVDSLWLRNLAPAARSLPIRLTSDEGRQLVLPQAAGASVSAWRNVRRAFTSPAGHVVRVDLAPWPGSGRRSAGPWPMYFLMTGLVLSAGIGVMVFQFLRARDYSAALAHDNRNLDARLAELARRDGELKNANEALDRRIRELTAELSEAREEVESFSHSVAHDLRSPLGSILNHSAVLEADRSPVLGEEQRRRVARIGEAAQRAAYLLNGLLEFGSSRARPGPPQVLDMKEIAERACAEAVADEFERGNVRFEIDRLPPAYGDPIQVNRILANLLGNALKFSRGRTREIRIGGASGPTESTYWVKDNGPGFEPSSAAEIFKPFRRLGVVKVEGAGLGLAIVERTVRGQGGRAWADSDGRSGAGFYFTLPSSGSRHGNGPARTDRG